MRRLSEAWRQTPLGRCCGGPVRPRDRAGGHPVFKTYAGFHDIEQNGKAIGGDSCANTAEITRKTAAPGGHHVSSENLQQLLITLPQRFEPRWSSGSVFCGLVHRPGEFEHRCRTEHQTHAREITGCTQDGFPSTAKLDFTLVSVQAAEFCGNLFAGSSSLGTSLLE